MENRLAHWCCSLLWGLGFFIFFCIALAKANAGLESINQACGASLFRVLLANFVINIVLSSFLCVVWTLFESQKNTRVLLRESALKQWKI
jgi:hypothetical protein